MLTLAMRTLYTGKPSHRRTARHLRAVLHREVVTIERSDYERVMFVGPVRWSLRKWAVRVSAMIDAKDHDFTQVILDQVKDAVGAAAGGPDSCHVSRSGPCRER